MALNLIFLGPPGAGKGTVTQAVMDEYKLTQLSTGDLVRAEIASGSDFGKDLQKIINAGQLVSDDLISKMFEVELSKIVSKKNFSGVVFDGFPRTLPQAQILDVLLKKFNQKLTAVIYIESSKESVVHRLSGRWSCPKCNKVYNTVTDPKPKKEGVCDIDGAKLFQREDDKPQTVAKRYDLFLEKTAPLISYYEKQKLLYRYDGNVPLPKSIESADRIIRSIVK